MTFEDFQQLCDQAASTGQAVSVPCPIVIGDGELQSAIGDTPFHQVVLFKTNPPNAAMQAIYGKVLFGFDAPNNQTLIAPKTHEAGA